MISIPRRGEKDGIVRDSDENPKKLLFRKEAKKTEVLSQGGEKNGNPSHSFETVPQCAHLP